MGAKDKLLENGLNPELVQALIELALSEDLADGPDITSLATIDRASNATLNLVARTSGVMAGVNVAQLVFELLSDEFSIKVFASDGQKIEANQVIISIKSPRSESVV